MLWQPQAAGGLAQAFVCLRQSVLCTLERAGGAGRSGSEVKRCIFFVFFFICCCPISSKLLLVVGSHWRSTATGGDLNIPASLLNPRIPFTSLQYTMRRRPRATPQSSQCTICLYCHVFFVCFFSYCISYLLIVLSDLWKLHLSRS